MLISAILGGLIITIVVYFFWFGFLTGYLDRKSEERFSERYDEFVGESDEHRQYIWGTDGRNASVWCQYHFRQANKIKELSIFSFLDDIHK